MSDMDQVLEKVDELEKVLHESDYFVHYSNLNDIINQSSEYKEIIERFRELADIVLSGNEGGFDNIEVVDSMLEIREEFDTIVETIRNDDVLKQFIKAEQEYFILIKEIQEAFSGSNHN